MINGLSFDIEEWFQVENLRPACPYEKWGDFESRVENSTMLLLDLLEKHNCKATFFVLGLVAKKNPELIKKIASLGHEIASHGYNHEIIYKLSPALFHDDLVRSKKILEDISNKEIIGYRAPSFSIKENSLWAIDILKELGFAYDSSIFPTPFHNRYGFNGIKDSRPFRFKNGLQEFPLATYKVLNINLPVAGGGYFRVCPYSLLKMMLKRLNNSGQSFIFYLHPWEIDEEQPRVKIAAHYKFRHYVNLGRTLVKLKRILKEFDFQPIRSFLE